MIIKVSLKKSPKRILHSWHFLLLFCVCFMLFLTSFLSFSLFVVFLSPSLLFCFYFIFVSLYLVLLFVYLSPFSIFCILLVIDWTKSHACLLLLIINQQHILFAKGKMLLRCKCYLLWDISSCFYRKLIFNIESLEENWLTIQSAITIFKHL